MKLTPLDIQHHEFRKKGGKYESAEVDSFLELVRLDYEDALRQLEMQRERVSRQEAQLAELHASERILKDAIISAQKIIDDMKVNAQKEAEVIVAQSRVEADKIVESARRDVQRIHDEIAEIRRQRVQLESQLRAVLHAHHELLEASSERTREDDNESAKLKVFPQRS